MFAYDKGSTWKGLEPDLTRFSGLIANCQTVNQPNLAHDALYSSHDSGATTLSYVVPRSWLNYAILTGFSGVEAVDSIETPTRLNRLLYCATRPCA
jgi:hypothetical protein